jgi:hypothetical protein
MKIKEMFARIWLKVKVWSRKVYEYIKPTLKKELLVAIQELDKLEAVLAREIKERWTTEERNKIVERVIGKLPKVVLVVLEITGEKEKLEAKLEEMIGKATDPDIAVKTVMDLLQKELSGLVERM